MTENILDHTANTITNGVAFCLSAFPSPRLSFLILVLFLRTTRYSYMFSFFLFFIFFFTVSPSSYVLRTIFHLLFVSVILYASIIKHLCPLIVPRTTIQHLLKCSLEFLLGTYISIYVYPPIYIYRLFFFYSFIYNNSFKSPPPSPPTHPSPVHPDLSSPLSLSPSLVPTFLSLSIYLSAYLRCLSNDLAIHLSI